MHAALVASGCKSQVLKHLKLYANDNYYDCTIQDSDPIDESVDANKLDGDDALIFGDGTKLFIDDDDDAETLEFFRSFKLNS